MARPIKKGLDYFPMDCDSDDKIYQLEAKLGGEGCWRLIKIWKEIYKWEGYYVNWGEKQVEAFAKKHRYRVSNINNLVEFCLDIDLFSRKRYEQYHILTSKGTQLRYLNIAKIRPLLTVVKEYLLESTNNFIKEENIKLKFTHINSELITQSKVKESKVKESNKNKINSTLTTKKEEEKKPIKKDYSSGEFNPVWLTEKEYQKLVSRFGKEDTDDKIHELSKYGKYDKYKDHYSTIANWLKMDRRQEEKKEQPIEEEGFEPGSYVNFRKELKKKK